MQKYYNDNNKQVYDCTWQDILSKSTNLYIEEDKNFSFINYDAHPNKEKLKKVFYLTVISKHTRDSDLDEEKNKTDNNLNKENKQSWELPDFFEGKQFFIYGNYEAKSKNLLSRNIIAFGGY
jgi:hypothetical protein